MNDLKKQVIKKHLISHFLDELSLDTKIRCTKCHFIYTVWSPLEYVRGTLVLRTKRLIWHVFLWKRVRQNVSPCHSKCGTDKTFNSNGVFSVWIECFIWNVKQWINQSINQSIINNYLYTFSIQSPCLTKLHLFKKLSTRYRLFCRITSLVSKCCLKYKSLG